MIKRLIAQSFIWLIIIGSISYAVAWILGDPTPTILSQYTIDYGNGVAITLYKMDVHKYLVNLQNSIEIPFKNMWLDPPAPYGYKFSGNAIETIINILKQLPNSYIWVINMILWIANITIIMPTKLIIHPLILTMSLLGINTTNLGIVEVANKIYNANISYILYI